MAYDYYELLAKTQNWFETHLAAGRLRQNQAQALSNIDHRAPRELFACKEGENLDRPLIVAFMGGSGVGKSSLINRLAGQTIARAGVERPTSREVTLYHHQSRPIQHFPAGLPLGSINISRHNDDANSNIVWIDMPDFDSIELGNHHLVLEWLPHIDVLIYVVSPERYRDNKAWQLLLAEGMKHAWLFVMNHWDIGSPLQYEDFKRQLLKAGFENPLMFRTSCREPKDDEFAELLIQLKALSGQHSVAQLEQRSSRQRWEQLKTILENLHVECGNRDFQQLGELYTDIWRTTEISLQQGLAWPVRQIAQFWSGQPGQKPDIKLWDDWAQSRFADCVDELALQAAQLDITGKHFKSGLLDIKNQAEKAMNNAAELAARQALLAPGNKIQRFLLTFTFICETLLPLTAMAVVGYQVFMGYYQSANGIHAYLGTDFAVHSIMLIGLSWLIPFFAHKKIQPSRQSSLEKGLEIGLRQGLSSLDAGIRRLIREEQTCNTQMLRELAEIIGLCEPASPATAVKGSLLERMLPAEAVGLAADAGK